MNTVIPHYSRDWLQARRQIPESVGAQVPYIKWQSTIGPTRCKTLRWRQPTAALEKDLTEKHFETKLTLQTPLFFYENLRSR